MSAVECGASTPEGIDVPAPDADEEARRREIMARASSRERVKKLMERLPSCEEWLDDAHDDDVKLASPRG